MKWLFAEQLPRNEVATTWPERKYSEKLANVRLVFRSFVQWYIMFWTINIAILQIQYLRSEGVSGTDLVQAVIAAIFVVLNLMGIGLCLFIGRALREDTYAATRLAAEIDAVPDRAFNAPLFNYVMIAGAMSLVLNCAIWTLMMYSSTFGHDAASSLIRSFIPHR